MEYLHNKNGTLLLQSAVFSHVKELAFPVMQPDVTLVFVTGALQPGIAFQMTDHPAGVHLEAGSNCLRMQIPAGDGREAIIHALIDVVAQTKNYLDKNVSTSISSAYFCSSLYENAFSV